jgi:queuine/archaeosine tRNA-ribosyltransferase
MRLIYSPVSTHINCLVNEYHPYTLFNPLRQADLEPPIGTEDTIYENFADSGGYQIYRYFKSVTKRCLVIPGVKNKNGSRLIIIDPIDLCRKYGELSIKWAFTLDHPLSDDPTDEEYRLNLEKSYSWAKMMFEIQNTLCPATEFLIPLHFRNKPELHHYYEVMSTLNPKGYAFATRFDLDLRGVIRIADTLSFLHSKHVPKVHIFGTSSKEIIFIGAAAVGLGMFDQLSFDSRTWNQTIFNSVAKHIDPYTLRYTQIFDSLPASSLLSYKVAEKLGLSIIDINTKIGIDLLMLHNAFAITEYANQTADRARHIGSYREFIKKQPYISRKNLDLAVQILELAVQKGYFYLDRVTGWLW